CDMALGVQHTPVNINDQNACTTDACNALTGVSHTPIVCNDNSICTQDSCAMATGCVFTPIIYFADTFSVNTGWQLGTNWQIGSATASSGQNDGFPDPAQDHTPTADNLLAGVNIGGNAPKVVMPAPSYMVSPIINMSGVNGPVTLEFWRWLNTDVPQ